LDQQQDLWLWDFTRGQLTRLTFDPTLEITPVWAADGRHLLFGSARLGVRNIFEQASDGTGTAARVVESSNLQDPTSVTPDGMRIVLNEQTLTQGRDIRLLTRGPTPHVESLIATPFEERGGVVSPNGRWLAYESNTSGQFEIYVRPFPSVADGQWLVSTGGGVEPLWAPNGQELFYRTPDGAVMAARVDPSASTWSAGTPAQLVAGAYFTGGGNVSRQYDVTADGQRFVMIKEGGGDGVSRNLALVLNWTEELKRLVPAK
jgi:Tol biopolymer transport system component